jgi:hypothetical protein
MANKVISMQQIRTIIQLLEKGYSLRAISAEMRLSRPTVTFYATRLKHDLYSLADLRQLSDEALAKVVYTSGVVKPLPGDARRQELDLRMPYFLSELKRTQVLPGYCSGKNIAKNPLILCDIHSSVFY